MQSCVILAEILATPFSAYSMTFDLWYPYILGLIIIVLGSAPSIFIPETLDDAKAKMKSLHFDIESESYQSMEPPGKQSLSKEILQQAKEFKESTGFIWRDGNICLLILVAGVSFMSRESTNLMLQFASKKFNWSIGEVSNIAYSWLLEHRPTNIAGNNRPAYLSLSEEYLV